MSEDLVQKLRDLRYQETELLRSVPISTAIGAHLTLANIYQTSWNGNRYQNHVDVVWFSESGDTLNTGRGISVALSNKDKATVALVISDGRVTCWANTFGLMPTYCYGFGLAGGPTVFRLSRGDEVPADLLGHVERLWI
jgi:hypothetical protein